jgi:hypothetical protein
MTPREAAIVSAYTGILIGDLQTLHEYIEEKFSSPVWVHQLADPVMADRLKELSRSDFIAIEVMR